MIDLRYEYTKSIHVNAPYEQIFDKLTDIPFIASHYPDVAEIEPYQNGYLWKMNKIGTGKLSFQVLYANQYPSDKENKMLRWEPIDGIGNALISGSWDFDVNGDSTRLTLFTNLELSLNLSGLFKKPAEAILNSESNKRMDQYLDNLKKSLEGGDGMIRRF